MPKLFNRIGLDGAWFEFDSMTAPAGFEHELRRVISRNGVDGVGVQNLGFKGAQFNLTTVHFVADFAAAASALVSYQALCNEGPQEIWRNSVGLGTYYILRVSEQAPPKALDGSIGTIIPDAKALHVCRWTVVNDTVGGLT